MARLVSIEGIPVVNAGKNKPVRLVRGRRLKALTGAIQHLNTLLNQDSAEQNRASSRRYTPFLILGLPNSPAMKAFTTLFKTLTEAKAAKA